MKPIFGESCSVLNWSWKRLETRKCWHWSAWNQSENCLGSSWWGQPKLGKKLQDICVLVTLRHANTWIQFWNRQVLKGFMTQPHSRLVLFVLHATGAEGDSARGTQTLFAGTRCSAVKLQPLPCFPTSWRCSAVHWDWAAAHNSLKTQSLTGFISQHEGPAGFCLFLACFHWSVQLPFAVRVHCFYNESQLLEEKQKSSILTKNMNVAMIFKMNNWTLCLNKQV